MVILKLSDACKIYAITRLKKNDLSVRKTASELGISRSTIDTYVRTHGVGIREVNKRVRSITKNKLCPSNEERLLHLDWAANK